ncbi:MAG: TonB-dependent receptor [Crocinitomicaceae bacterium]|nr:TonB-dependent receptor [Crocinitomicaceae bacterium]
MNYTLLLIAALFSIISFAQPPGGGYKGERPKIGVLTGHITDKASGENIGFAKIVLLNRRDSSIVTGGLSTENGTFRIDEIPVGAYIAKITSFGYQTFYKDSLFFFPKRPETDLGTISLEKDKDLLNEVEVVHETGELQVQIDRKIFNVEKQLTAQGGTALDALENVPSVTVDMEGNVSLRGSANVTILIDGRPSSLTGGGRQGALESIPASAIESIEVITNPSAKYDPDGMSGIINIVLKKNKLKGFNGNVDLSLENGIHWDSLDTYDNLLGINYNLNANLAYRNKYFNIYGGYSRRHYEGYRNFNSTNETWYNDVYDKLEQDRSGTHMKSSDMFKGGMDFYLHKNHNMGFSFTANISDNDRTGNMIYREYNDSGLYDKWQRLSNDPSIRNGYDGSFYYEWKMKKQGQSLELNAQYSAGGDVSEGVYTENQFDPVTNTITEENYLDQYVRTGGGNNISNVQVDYYHPIENGKIEAGAKSTFRDIRESYFQSTNGNVDDSLNNRFSYNEQVHAVYGIYGKEWKKFKFQVGMRLEQVFVLGQLDNDSTDYTNQYFSFYPSVHMTKPLSKSSELTLSYSRRVNRPHMHAINPFSRYSDPYNLRVGNPELNPEYINSVEIGYGQYSKKLTLTASMYYRLMTDLIQRVKNVDSNGVATVSWQNLDIGHFYGVEGVAIYRPYKWWRMMLTGNFSQTFLNSTSGDADLNNSGFSWSSRIQNTFTFEKGWTAQLTGYYRSPIILAQGLSQPMYGMDAAVKYSFYKDKMYLNLKFSDVFNTRWFAYETSQPGVFVSSGKYKWQSRRVMLTFGYRFGNQDRNQRKRNWNGEGGGEGFGI